MKSYDAKGMMAFWTDIDAENLLEVQKWHNCEHMTERVSIPGFIVGRRYRGMDDAPTFFISYETRDTDVLQTLRDVGHTRTLATLTGTAPATEAPFNYVLRFNIDSDDEERELRQLKADYLPALTALPDVFRSRLYEIDEKISSIMTDEREIYGGGPGQQKYLLVVETAVQCASEADDWQQVNHEFSSLRGCLSDRYEEHSFLEFVMYAPD